MRNFKDFTRAIAGIASALKGINTVVDGIPVPGGGAGGIDFSTTEQDTGLKWVNGEPIYQITFSGTTPNAATGAVDFPEGLTMETPIETLGFAGPIDADRETYMPLDCKGLTVYIQTDEAKIYFDSQDANFRNKPFHITIRYTKPSE